MDIARPIFQIAVANQPDAFGLDGFADTRAGKGVGDTLAISGVITDVADGMRFGRIKTGMIDKEVGLPCFKTFEHFDQALNLFL